MTVLAFRPRRNPESPAADGDGIPLTGTFRSPRGQEGVMTGHLRLQRLVLAPRGAFVTGVFTGELREPDGTVVGRESRRTTVPADLVRDAAGLHPVVRPLELDLMGLAVHVHSFAIEPGAVFPSARATRLRGRPQPGRPRGDLR
jgi:hypothetical protein